MGRINAMSIQSANAHKLRNYFMTISHIDSIRRLRVDTDMLGGMYTWTCWKRYRSRGKEKRVVGWNGPSKEVARVDETHERREGQEGERVREYEGIERGGKDIEKDGTREGGGKAVSWRLRTVSWNEFCWINKFHYKNTLSLALLCPGVYWCFQVCIDTIATSVFICVGK